MILIKNLKCKRQIIWRGLTAKEEIFTAVREQGKSMLYCFQFWGEMSAYLRLALRTKHTWVKSTKITRNALQINKFSKCCNTYMCNKRGNVGEGSDGPYLSHTNGVALWKLMWVWVNLLDYLQEGFKKFKCWVLLRWFNAFLHEGECWTEGKCLFQ